MLLLIRTDHPTASLGLWQDGRLTQETTWPADRQLASRLLGAIDAFVAKAGGWPVVDGLVVYEGPGSFTGLRIGVTTANALAYARGLAIAGARGDGWRQGGAAALATGTSAGIVLPHYGADPHISMPKR